MLMKLYLLQLISFPIRKYLISHQIFKNFTQDIYSGKWLVIFLKMYRTFFLCSGAIFAVFQIYRIISQTIYLMH